MSDKLVYLTVLGFLPYHISYRRHGRRLWSLQVHSLFWELAVARLDCRCPAGRRTYLTLNIPLIARLRTVIWSAVRSLIDA